MYLVITLQDGNKSRILKPVTTVRSLDPPSVIGSIPIQMKQLVAGHGLRETACSTRETGGVIFRVECVVGKRPVLVNGSAVRTCTY